MQVPQGERGREPRRIRLRIRPVQRKLDGCCRLKPAEDRQWTVVEGVAGHGLVGFLLGVVGRVFGAGANTQELDFGDDETVAAAMLAHHAVKVRQSAEVVDLLRCVLRPHPGVPLLVSLDDADEAAATVAVQSVEGDVVAVVGDEVRLGRRGGCGRVYGLHGEMAVLALGLGESGVHLDGEEVFVDLTKVVLRLRRWSGDARVRQLIHEEGKRQ